MIPRRQTVLFEIAWRLIFIVFAVLVVVSLTMVADGAIRMRPNEEMALRTRNPGLVFLALVNIVLRYQGFLGGTAAAMAAAIAGFWILGGALLRAAVNGRPLLALLGIRSLQFVAGATAAASCVALVSAVAARKLSGLAPLLVVGVFSLLVYCCWRWISLVLAIAEQTRWRAGWETFTRQGPYLALDAATNSTLKWILQAACTLPALAVVLVAPRAAPAVTIIWVVALAVVSGYFAARFKERIPSWTLHTQPSPGA